ncbi:hypothetical protein DFH11DRAFT_418920 [Phellopilus nigrolimitatus]|nr:hypothetical protein DFH11DRAFT_418920 [Phellopilus nigrolimitatus]
MTSSPDTSASTAEAQKDASSSSKSFPLPSNSKRMFSKKDKDVLTNGHKHDASNDAAATAGSADANAPVNETDAGAVQGPSQSAPPPHSLQPSSSTREGDGSHSVEQGTMTTAGDRSLSTTVTGTATTSKHRKDKTSETAHSNTISEKPELRSKKPKKEKLVKRKRKSLWSKLASVVFKARRHRRNPLPQLKLARALSRHR